MNTQEYSEDDVIESAEIDGQYIKDGGNINDE